MSLTERLKKPNATPVYLIEVGAGEVLKGWQGSGPWTLDYPEAPKSIRVDGDDVDTWSWADGVLTLTLASGTPWTQTVQAIRAFRFCSPAGRVMDGKYWDGRILSLPDLSLRIEPRFGGVAQIGGGTLELNNGDGLLSAPLQWQAATTSILMGVDLPGSPMPFDQYEKIATFRNGAPSLSQGVFTLGLEEEKGRLLKSIPAEVYERVDYPLIEDGGPGMPIPLAYGRIRGVKPVCINRTTGRYKLAQHQIRNIDAVKKKVEERWVVVTSEITGINLASAEFTLTPATDDDGQPITDELSVDLQGAVDGDGNLIETSPDICEAVLKYLGYTDSIDTNSFTSSKNILKLSTDARFGNDVYLLNSWIYTGAQRSAVDFLSEILSAVGAYLVTGPDGRFRFELFDPRATDGKRIFTPSEIRDFTVEEDATVISEIIARYAVNDQESIAFVTKRTREENQHAYGQLAPSSEREDVNVYAGDDARYWAERYLITNGLPLKLYRFSTRWDGVMYRPGDEVVLQYDKNGHSVDANVEIIEQNVDLSDRSVDLVCSPLRGFETVGYWSEENPTIPGRFIGLTGYGDGSAGHWNRDWSPAIKAWARQNIGYWTDDNGLADPLDPDSYQLSRWF